MTLPARDLNGHIFGAFASAQATVSTVVLGLTDFGFTAEEIAAARVLEIHVNTNSIRYDVAGNAPTVSQGILLSSAEELKTIYSKNEIENFQVIRDDVTDSEVYLVLKN